MQLIFSHHLHQLALFHFTLHSKSCAEQLKKLNGNYLKYNLTGLQHHLHQQISERKFLKKTLNTKKNKGLMTDLTALIEI